MEQASDLRTTIAKNNALLDEGRIASLSQVSGVFWQSTYDGELYWHRVGLLPKCLREGIVQSPNVLEPIVVLRMSQEEVLGAVRPVVPIRHDLGWEPILDNDFTCILSMCSELEVVCNETRCAEPIPSLVVRIVSAGGKELSSFGGTIARNKRDASCSESITKIVLSSAASSRANSQAQQRPQRRPYQSSLVSLLPPLSRPIT